MLLKSTSLNTAREDFVAFSPSPPSLGFSLVFRSTVYYARTKKHVSPVGQIFVSIFPLPLAEFRGGACIRGRAGVSLEDSPGRSFSSHPREENR